jgi:hypothetical protein
MSDRERERITHATELPPIQFIAVRVLLHMAFMQERQRPFVVWLGADSCVVFFVDERRGTDVRGITRRATQATARATLRAEPGQILGIRNPLLPLA